MIRKESLRIIKVLLSLNENGGTLFRAILQKHFCCVILATSNTYEMIFFSCVIEVS